MAGDWQAIKSTPETMATHEAKVVIVNFIASVLLAFATNNEKLKPSPNAKISDRAVKSLNGHPNHAMMETAKAAPKSGGKITRHVLNPK